MILLLSLLLTAQVRYTNQNIAYSYQYPPKTFIVTEGGAYGELENGVEFSQTNIVNNYTKLQKFQLQDAWWYISDKGIIGYGLGINDLEALSIYLAS